MDKYLINIDGQDVVYYSEGELDMFYPKNEIGICIYYLGIHKTYLKLLNAKKFLGISADKVEVYEGDMVYVEIIKHVKATIENKDFIPDSTVNKPLWAFSTEKGFYLSPVATEYTIADITKYLDFVGYKRGEPMGCKFCNNIITISIINSVVVKKDKILINDKDINDCFLIKKVCNT